MESSTTPNYGEKRIQRNTRIKSAIHDVYFFGHSEAIKKTPYKVKTRFLRDEGEISPCSVCGRAARAARPTTHRRSAEPRATGEIEAIWRRLARRKRDGGELEASWRRDADGGETADADEVEARWQMEARDGGEMQMEARWRRAGGETGARWRRRRGWRRRVARAAKLATHPNPNPNQSAELRL